MEVAVPPFSRMICVFALLVFSTVCQSAPVKCELNFVDFKSNIHKLWFNGESLAQHGEQLPDVEWTLDSPQAIIMQGIGSELSGTVGFRIEGVEVGSKIAVKGVAKNYYAFDLSGEMFLEQLSSTDGLVQVEVKSSRALPQSLKRLDDEILWTVSVTTPDGKTAALKADQSARVSCYLVFSDNHDNLVDGAEPTPNRIEHSYYRFQSATGYLTLAYGLPNMAHSLNRQVSRYYNPANHYTNETCWNVPRSWGVRGGGASCISISRYCQHVLLVLGFPGKVEVDAFWAKPSNPREAIGGGTDAPDIYSSSRSGSLKLYLVDGRNTAGGGSGGYGGMNNYEGALIYTSERGEVYYYPGGTQHMYRNKNQILSVFKSLAWARYDYRARQWQVVQVIAAYQGGVGSAASARSSSASGNRRPGLLGRVFGRS